MKTMSALCRLLLCGLSVASPLCLRADDVIGDNLIITGNADVGGTTFNLGTNAATSDPGIVWEYSDGTTATITVSSSRNVANWQWKHNASGTPVLSMKLDSGHQLILYGSNGTTPGVTLNPGGTSAFANGITIGGSSVLTVSSGNSAYVRQDVTQMALGTNTAATGANSFAIGVEASAVEDSATAIGSFAYASGLNSVAIGASSGFGSPGARASGDSSVSLGSSSLASGESAVAMGGGEASGYSSTALGYGYATGGLSFAVGLSSEASGLVAIAMGAISHASGIVSTAMGEYSTSSGYASTAMGSRSTASGDYATATGYGTEAQGYGQFTTGRYNIVQGSADTWVGTDDLFIVGNGTDTVPSNALVIKKNGDAKLSGNFEVTGKIRVPPQGDISMGEFTAE
jgi:hypothetical protein